jgi:hypothetical protein
MIATWRMCVPKGKTHCVTDVVVHKGLPGDPWKRPAIVFCVKIWNQLSFLRLLECDRLEVDFGLGRIETSD